MNNVSQSLIKDFRSGLHHGEGKQAENSEKGAGKYLEFPPGDRETRSGEKGVEFQAGKSGGDFWEGGETEYPL